MRRAALALALLAAACAGPRRAAAPAAGATAPPAERVEVTEPETVVAGPEDVELAAKDDEELLAIGEAALAAGALERAANALGRIVELFPSSPRVTQARFSLGEVWRARFEAAPLLPPAGHGDGAGDPEGEAAALARTLEAKSRLLLAAQQAYLATIRAGDATWAVAAGERIGGLYDALHAALRDAPEPVALTPGQRAAYRAELRRQTRPLVETAISAYEQTIAEASRTGVEGGGVARARASLERLRRELEAP